NRAYWDSIIAVKTAVNKQIEEARNNKLIGANLEAEVDLFCSSELAGQINALGEELRFVLITSAARVQQGDEGATTDVTGLKVKVSATQHPKCVRCWHHRADVGNHAEHPELCGRCVENVAGQGEPRLYA
ncbi:MAG TPA: zinc finger domain-containing protein, partial [Pseudomonadales bacterium]|nr:zinc finger domain-containing protein [Pseudomonadales bacterium]